MPSNACSESRLTRSHSPETKSWPNRFRSCAVLDRHTDSSAGINLSGSENPIDLPNLESISKQSRSATTLASAFATLNISVRQQGSAPPNESEQESPLRIDEHRQILLDKLNLYEEVSAYWQPNIGTDHHEFDLITTPFSSDAQSSARPLLSTPGSPVHQGSDNDHEETPGATSPKDPHTLHIKTWKRPDFFDGACDDNHSVPFLTGDEHNASQFIDPFTGGPAFDDRQPSDASSTSCYLRPHAFANHRDTFARIFPAQKGDFNSQSFDQGQSRRLSIDFSLGAGKRFSKHRDTLARLHFSQNKSRLVPALILDKILCYLSFDDYKSLRLTCRQWHNALPCVMLPPASRLPAEILNHVYEYLRPCDFDAARHTCRLWFLASLDRKAGRSALKKAGCYAGFLSDIEHRRQILHSRHLRRVQQLLSEHEQENAIDFPVENEDTFDEEWLISKRLATEARLSTGWHGPGLPRDSGHSSSRLSTTDVIDFPNTDFTGDTEHPRLKAKKFTVSVCGNFVLVVVDTDVLVYSLDGGNAIMRPCVRLLMGSKILSISMDSSSGRHAIGVLLQGRIGMCWELDDILADGRSFCPSGEELSLGMHTDVHGSSSAAAPRDLHLSLPDWSKDYSVAPESVDSDEQAARPRLGVTSTSAPTTSTGGTLLASLRIGLPGTSSSSAKIPIRSKPSSIYRNLGCTDDEPQSVAICPSRKCVAFGCRTGIELHWIDRLTGSDLNRWFPLAAPSEFLYFLPQRLGIDPAEKLRLISSSSGVSRSTASRTSLDNTLRTIDCDHFRAIPLSDGSHMLFTDPATGVLCLGSDAPLGGPTRLIRKVCMAPPASDDVLRTSLRCYAVGRELGWGVRIVAAYQDGSVVLYNIPSDYFERIRYMHSSPEIWDAPATVLTSRSMVTDASLTNAPAVDNAFRSIADSPAPESQTLHRSLYINGALIGRVQRDVEDLQVDCQGGGFRLWIFHHSGQARRLDVYVPRDHRVGFHTVQADGSICSVTQTPAFQAVDWFAQQEKTGVNDDVARLTQATLANRQIKFVGLDGASDIDHYCAASNLEEKLGQLEKLNEQSREQSPDQATSFIPQAMLAPENEGRLQLQVLTDFRNQMLLSSYMLHLD